VGQVRLPQTLVLHGCQCLNGVCVQCAVTLVMGVRTEQCQRLYSDLALQPQKLGKRRGTFWVKSDSHSLKNRKAESQNVYQHVADGHSHPILNFSWLVIRSCTNLKFVKHNERGRGKADGRYDRSSIVLYVALGFRTCRLTQITLKHSWCSTPRHYRHPSVRLCDQHIKTASSIVFLKFDLLIFKQNSA